MNALLRWLRKIAVLLRRTRFDQELQEEMAFHQEQAAKEFESMGITPEAARYAAMRQFGNATVLKERSHEVMGFRAETVVQDLRFAARQLRRSPGLAVTAILVLALGIGASTAIFGFVDSVLIQPLPYANPNRLVDVDESSANTSAYQPVAGRLRGLEAAEYDTQLARCIRRDRFSAAYGFPLRARAGSPGQRRIFSHARGRTYSGARLPPGRGQARTAEDRNPLLRHMDEAFRWPSRCDWGIH